MKAFVIALLAAVVLHAPAHAQVISQEDGGVVNVGAAAPLYVRTKDLTTSALDIAVAQSGDTDLVQFSVGQTERAWVQITCTGQDLDAFIVLGRAHSSGAWLTLASSGSHYTSPAGVVFGASGDLTTLAAGSTGWIALDVQGLDAVKLQASSGNVAGSTVTVYVGGR